MYENKDNSFIKKYWVERGNLIVKGGINYSQMKDEPEDDLERLKVFQLLRLERLVYDIYDYVLVLMRLF